MALPIVIQPDTAPRPARPGARPAARPGSRLVVIEGGRSAAARRRRRVFLARRCLVAALALVVGYLAVAGAGALVGGGAEVPAAVAVQPGDTLWSIAGDLGVDADRRQVVDLLADANGGAVVVPGQRLVVPESVRSLG